jgi:glycosyltransferase involved in cell wall biosynthesis
LYPVKIMAGNFMQMRVLQLIQKPQLRGAEIFACQLSKEFADRGIHVDVVYLFEHENFALEFDLNFIPLHADQKSRLWDLRAYKRLNQIVRKGEYDIVQANAADTLKYAVTSKLLFGWKAKIIFRNASLMGRLMHSIFQKLYNRWLLGQCEQIISVSENCRQDLIRFFPKAKQVSVTIPIGTYLFDDAKVRGHPRPDQGPVFLHVGSFVWEKNHEFLISIFHRYFQLHNMGYLWLVGDGKLRAPIEAKVKELKLDDRVIFWGSRKDVVSFLKSADLFIMPSVVEGMPGVILEALSCGLPVLASNAGGIPEIIKHAVNGYCLRALTEEDYVNCMDILTTNTTLRAQFIKAGKTLIRDSYNMPLIADQFLNSYKNIIAGK